MIFGLLINISVGSILIYIGCLIWIKQKISLLHSYHYANVKKEDLKAYGKQMGIGNIILGIGVSLMGICTCFQIENIGWIIFMLSIIISIIIFHKAQMKYNGSWFSLKK